MRLTADDIRALASQGLTKAEAARAAGLDRSYFARLAKTEAPDAEWLTGGARSLARVRACAARGLSRLEIAAETGISYKRVCDIVRRHGLRVRGAEHGPHYAAHLSPTQLEDYRTFRRAKFSAAEALAMVGAAA